MCLLTDKPVAIRMDNWKVEKKGGSMISFTIIYYKKAACKLKLGKWRGTHAACYNSSHVNRKDSRRPHRACYRLSSHEYVKFHGKFVLKFQFSSNIRSVMQDRQYNEKQQIVLPDCPIDTNCEA